MTASSRLFQSNVASSCPSRSFCLISHARCLLICSSSNTRLTFISLVARHNFVQLHTLRPHTKSGFQTPNNTPQLRPQIAQSRSTFTQGIVREHIRGGSLHLLSAHCPLHLHRQASLSLPVAYINLTPAPPHSSSPAPAPASQPRHNTVTMAKKLTVSSESSLSPVPEDIQDEIATTVKTPPISKKRKVEAAEEPPSTKHNKKSKANRSVQQELSSGEDEVEVEEELTIEDDATGNTKIAKKTITRKKKQAALTPLVERTEATKLLMGAHVSTAGGVHNAVTNLLYIGLYHTIADNASANAFALFLKNQRKWSNPELDPEFAKLFIAGCKEHGIDVAKCCLPHGSYLVNLAHPDPQRKKQAYDSFLNDLVRCHTLGIKLYNFHPGNANATTSGEGIRTIADNINEAHRDPSSGEVVAVLETMASQGNTIGGTFGDLAAIISRVTDKSRVGVCLDTCHVFAAGYDLRTPEAYATTMAEFDKVIGLKYLKALHINDSKAPIFSNRDLHARIGTGYLGLRAFHNIVNDERLHGLPMVLETPVDVVDENGKKSEDKGIWAREIKMLESLVGMDVESEEFKKMESELAKEGEGERIRVGEQVEKKKVKDAKPKKKGKGKKKVETESEDDDE